MLSILILLLRSRRSLTIIISCIATATMIGILRKWLFPSSLSELESLSTDALKKYIDRWDKRGSWLTAMVVIGLLAEVVFSSIPNSSKYAIFPNSIVFSGVAGEWLAHRLASRAGNVLSERQEREIAQLRERAALAEKVAAELKLALAELEASVAPRHLIPQQQFALSEEMKKFRSQRIEMFIFGAIPEIADIAGEIRGSLCKANWYARTLGCPAPTLSARDIGIMVPNDADSETRDAAARLAAILIEDGIKAKMTPWFDITVLRMNFTLITDVLGWEKGVNPTIVITIGSKTRIA